MRPNSAHAYNRLLVLKTVIDYSYAHPPKWEVEKPATRWSDVERDEFNADCKALSDSTVAGLHKGHLWEFVSPEEEKFLLSYGLNMDTYAQINASWRMEGAGMLMWALNIIDKWPDIDAQMDPDLLECLPLSPGHKPRLRKLKELSEKCNILWNWNWRSRTRRLIEEGRDLNPDAGMKRFGMFTHDDVIRKAAKEALEKHEIPEILDDDFVFRGKPFRFLSADEYSEAASIIQERHFALNWLLGAAPDNLWDETITDT